MIEQEAYRRLKSKGLLSLPFFLYGIVPPVITQPAFPASSSGVSNLQRCQAAGYLTLAAVAKCPIQPLVGFKHATWLVASGNKVQQIRRVYLTNSLCYNLIIVFTRRQSPQNLQKKG